MKKSVSLLILLSITLSGCTISSPSYETSSSISSVSSLSDFSESDSYVSVSSESSSELSEASSSLIESSLFKSSSYIDSSSELPSSEVSSSIGHDLWDRSQDYLRTGLKNIDFYNFNDFHGATDYICEGYTREQGIFRLSTYINNLKQNYPDSFVLTSSGDMWQGSAASNITKGKLVLDWMNYVGFEAMALGNHEFDWSIEQILENQKYSPNIPFLACNILDKRSGKPVDWVEPYTTITRNGVHIGVIGAIGEGITSDIVLSNVKDVYFDDPTEYVKKASTYLKNNGADVILYLLHDSVTTVSSTLSSYVDLVFGGHTHSGEQRTLSSFVPMIQAYSNGRDVGNITISYNFSVNRVAASSKKIVDLRYINIADDQHFVSYFNETYYDTIHAITDTVCGYTTETITSSGEVEACVTKCLYDYYEEYHGVYDISLVKHNVARSDIYAGEITYGMIYKAVPFENYPTVVKIKGKILNSSYNYFTTYAKRYDYLPKGESTVFDNNTDYYVLTINYISEKYEYLSCYEVVEKMPGVFIRDVLAEYIHCYYPLV